MMKREPAKLDQLNIVSSNMAASLAFYRRLGVEIPQEAVWSTESGAHHASAKASAGEESVDFDIDSVAFAQIWNSGWQGRDNLAGRIVVGFRLPSRERVDELYGEMTRAGYAGLQAPYDAFWGARYAAVEDPDGIAVGLMSPVSSELRSQPPKV
jgi:uncharacterized glyoxalase superfamily protein PhnB